MKTREPGAALLIPVLLIVTVAAFAVVVAASHTGGDIHGSDGHADSLEALYLAETGVERALKRFASGAANCGATAPTLAESITNLSQLGLSAASGRSIEILEGLQTDFAGITLPALTRCRVRVTGKIHASNISRTLHAIVDRNLLEGPDNPTYDYPVTTAVAPSGWVNQTPAAAFAPSGGADGATGNGAIPCRRSAWTARVAAVAVANNRRASAKATVAGSIVGANQTTIAFHRRVISRTVNCGTPPGTLAGALPAACGAALDSTVCLELIGVDSVGGAQTWTAATNSNVVGNSAQAACPSVFNPCTTDYQALAPGTKVTLAIDMTKGGVVNPGTLASPGSVATVNYYLQLQNAGSKELFVDYIEVANASFVGAAQVRVWRDCSSALDPTTCLNPP